VIDGIFVTGTDTGVGKTRVSVALLRTLTEMGHCCIGMKPVACGCEHTPNGWRHGDALELMRASSIEVGYDEVNPYPLIEAIAPHLAARQMGVEIDIGRLSKQARELRARADIVVVEGAGGLLVPLRDKQTQVDLIATLGLPILLVVGIRLGCLNHALLSLESLLRRELPVMGWVANCCDGDMQYPDENIETLRDMLDIPLLAVAGYAPDGRDDRLAQGIRTGLTTYLANPDE